MASWHPPGPSPLRDVTPPFLSNPDTHSIKFGYAQCPSLSLFLPLRFTKAVSNVHHVFRQGKSRMQKSRHEPIYLKDLHNLYFSSESPMYLDEQNGVRTCNGFCGLGGSDHGVLVRCVAWRRLRSICCDTTWQWYPRLLSTFTKILHACIWW